MRSAHHRQSHCRTCIYSTVPVDTITHLHVFYPHVCLLSALHVVVQGALCPIALGHVQDNCLKLNALDLWAFAGTGCNLWEV